MSNKSHRAAGFTLLELMLVLLVLGAAAGMIVATLPARDAHPQAEKLLIALRWSAEQAEIESQVYRLQLRHDGWQLYRLEMGTAAEETFLPGYRWQAVPSTLAHQRLPEGIRLRAYQQQRLVSLPTDLLFLPDGSAEPLTLELTAKDSPPQRIQWVDGQYQPEDEP